MDVKCLVGNVDHYSIQCAQTLPSKMSFINGEHLTVFIMQVQQKVFKCHSGTVQTSYMYLQFDSCLHNVT